MKAQLRLRCIRRCRFDELGRLCQAGERREPVSIRGVPVKSFDEGEPGMLYTAQIHLDVRDLANEISQVREWLETRVPCPNTFHYRVGESHVRLGLDFSSLNDASAFAEAFGGVVLGVKDAAQPAD
jgi:hypothetical protein